MDDGLFTSIISQLGAMEWGGVLAFHRYNEPTADEDYLIRRLRECREKAPRASVKIFTNGDYLTTDYIEKIYEAGCRSILCSIYPQEGSAYDESYAMTAISRRLRKFALPYVWTNWRSGNHVIKINYKDMDFVMRAIDYSEKRDDHLTMSNRGGALDGNESYQRHLPCLKPFMEMQIEVDGTLMPCCDLRSDWDDHKPYVLGKLNPGDNIAASWANQTSANWRKTLFSFEPKPKPCANCFYVSMADTAANRSLVNDLRRQCLP